MSPIKSRLRAASEIGVDSILAVPSESGEPPAHLTLTYKVAGDKFTRLWKFVGYRDLEAQYQFVGDSSPSYPGGRRSEVEANSTAATVIAPEWYYRATKS